MSTVSPRRHTHDSTSRPRPHHDPNDQQHYKPRYELTTSPPCISAYMEEYGYGQPDQSGSYPASGSTTVNGNHRHRAHHRPPPRLVQRSSFTSSTHGRSHQHSRTGSSGAGTPRDKPLRRSSDDTEDHASQASSHRHHHHNHHQHHRSGSNGSDRSHAHHVHHRPGHAHHRQYSGHRDENGHGHHRVETHDVLDEEAVEDEDADARVHVEVHNAEQFWAGTSERIRALLLQTC